MDPAYEEREDEQIEEEVFEGEDDGAYEDMIRVECDKDLVNIDTRGVDINGETLPDSLTFAGSMPVAYEEKMRSIAIATPPDDIIREVTEPTSPNIDQIDSLQRNSALGHINRSSGSNEIKETSSTKQVVTNQLQSSSIIQTGSYHVTQDEISLTAHQKESEEKNND